MLIDHDLHVHTHLSACSHDPNATGKKILERAAQVGLKTIGFADHMWDRKRPGGSSWYMEQDVDHISRIREEVLGHGTGVRVLFGCETEYCGEGRVGISRETAELLDFVLIPMSHFHMRGFVVPEGLEEPEEVSRMLLCRFKEVVELGLATGIPHPFMPFGYSNVDEIVGNLSGQALQDCFGLAKEKGVSIEITKDFFPSLREGETEEFHDSTFMRVLGVAKEMECFFHFASDTHALEGVGDVKKLAPYVDALGITSDEILPLARGIAP